MLITMPETIVELIQFASNSSYRTNDFLFRALTRNEISPRLLTWAKLFQQYGYDQETAFLFSSIVGEIGNNCFDHNLGKWKTATGCLIGFDFLPDRFRMTIVDLGQGIVSSLKEVRPEIKNNEDYLKIAFEEIVSGRSPEQRGNGLKYVKKNFINEKGLELFCLSYGYKYRLGLENNLITIFQPIKNFEGTLVSIDWPRAGAK